jgi:uncharacterized protein (TIGR03437 family)
MGGREAALLYVSPKQINAQVPRDLAPGNISVTVSQGVTQSNTISFTLAR